MQNDDAGRRLLSRLFEHTLSNDPNIRAAAYTAMTNFEPDSSILTCLNNGLNDHDAIVRRAAGGALIQLGCLNPVADGHK